MLLYHPAFDAHHAAFRILRILDASGYRSYERDAVRILDFYLVFPQLISEMRLSRTQQNIKRLLARRENKYHFSGSPRLAFAKMAPLQELALKLLASKRMIVLDRLLNNVVVRTELALPAHLGELIRDRNRIDSDLMQFLINDLGQMPLIGDDGLKARSSLMDYRYDQT